MKRCTCRGRWERLSGVGAKSDLKEKILTKLADCGPVITIFFSFAEEAILAEFKHTFLTYCQLTAKDLLHE